MGALPRPLGRVGLAAALVLSVAATSTQTAWGAGDGPRQVTARSFDRTDFPAVPSIDNRLLPWTPGTRLVYEGEVVEGSTVLAHRVVIEVTDLVKVVDGVATLVILDRDISEGQPLESELAFQAQDRNGTVWSLGEYPEEFEDGEFAGAPSTWLSGVARARAGILFQARPKVGGFTYSQGLAPKIDFADRGSVIAKRQRVCVPVRCFSGVWIVDEFDAMDPAGGHQLKYHAPGVGVVFIEAQGGDSQETLSLVSVEQMTADELADVRQQARRLDRRAYTHAADVYGGTEPVHRL